MELHARVLLRFSAKILDMFLTTSKPVACPTYRKTWIWWWIQITV